MLVLLVSEVLAALRNVARPVLESPFTLTHKQWVPILIATCVRLGWVSEHAASERSAKTEVFRAMSALNLQHRNVLTWEQVVSIFEQLFQQSKPGSNHDRIPCPPGLLRDAEFRIFHKLGERFRESSVLTDVSPASASALVVVSPVSGQQAGSVRVSSAQSRRHSVSTMSSASMSPQSVTSAHQSVVSVDHLSQVPGPSGLSIVMPALPQNLDDLSRGELKQLLVDQHAQWIRAANRIATTSAQRAPAASKVVQKQHQRKVRYWKNKAKRDKSKVQEKFDQLVRETDPYIHSKRRKKTAFRMKLSIFGGLGSASEVPRKGLGFVSSSHLPWS